MKSVQEKRRPGEGRRSGQRLVGRSTLAIVQGGRANEPEAVPSVDLRDAVARLSTLPMRDLAAALNLEFSPWDDVEFQCPRTRGRYNTHYARLASAAVSESCYVCPTCRASGTRWELERLVREDANALRLVKAWMEAAV